MAELAICAVSKSSSYCGRILSVDNAILKLQISTVVYQCLNINTVNLSLLN